MFSVLKIESASKFFVTVIQKQYLFAKYPEGHQGVFQEFILGVVSGRRICSRLEELINWDIIVQFL